MRVLRTLSRVSSASVSGILERPLQVPLLRTCPHCDQTNSLVFLEEVPDETHKSIRIYQCSKCGQKAEFAQSLPPEAV